MVQQFAIPVHGTARAVQMLTLVTFAKTATFSMLTRELVILLVLRTVSAVLAVDRRNVTGVILDTLCLFQQELALLVLPAAANVKMRNTVITVILASPLTLIMAAMLVVPTVWLVSQMVLVNVILDPVSHHFT